MGVEFVGPGKSMLGCQIKMKFVSICAFLCMVVKPGYSYNETVYGYEGESIKLVCVSPVTNITKTTWYGHNGSIYFINWKKNPNVSNIQHFSVMENNKSNAYDLYITNISSSDVGNYSCSARGSTVPPPYFYFLGVYVDVHNVSLIPSYNPLIIREQMKQVVKCVVNSNATPAPNITWYLESTNIQSSTLTFSSTLDITGERNNTAKVLKCTATNNKKKIMTANTTLSIEYPPTVNTLPQHNIIEGRNLNIMCKAVPGHPSSTMFMWTKEGNPGLNQNGATLQLPNIQRTSSGPYKCTAENNYSNGQKGTDSQSMVVNVLYPPAVKTLSQQNIIEGRNLNLTCQADPGNPRSTMFIWNMEGSSEFTQNGATLQLLNIQRTSSGTYKCTAQNNYGNGQKGTDSQSVGVNVLYPPAVKTLSQKNQIEGRNLTVTCLATPGNPSPVTFYWTKEDNPGFRQNASILQLYNIQRNSAGSYRCTAENNYSNGQKGSNSQSMIVRVLYPPAVQTLSPQNQIEGRNLTVTCLATPGNPSPITFYWTKEDNPGFRQNASILQLYNIHRNSSGSYRCTAETNYGNGQKGSNSQSMIVSVLYPPAVNTLSKHNIREGDILNTTCQAEPGNPSSTMFIWTKEGDTGFNRNGAILRLLNIQRTSSGTYTCTAENNYGNGQKGRDSRSMVVNVLYKPEILENNPTTLVNETEQVTLIRQIVSNPLSNASWYNGSELLVTQPLVMNATFYIKEATCTDTKNFTLVASNIVQENVTALVELIVNCKPRSYKTNFTLGVTDTTGIDFSTNVIAYPQPFIKLEYENGTEANQMSKSISQNALNKFTIHISQAVVNESDFGIYHLKLWNLFGEITVIVNVIPQRKPNVPANIEIVCDETRAKVQWKSSFNGGDPQLFTVIASSGQQSNNISDKGENVIHSTFVQHLQPSTMYVFYVSAQNSHGFISSEKISCTTLAESSDKLPIIVGSAAAGGLTLAVVLVAIVFLFRRYTHTEKPAGKSQRFENDLVENESVDDDGLKDNILYISADPRENEKHEAAVYAAVNKKDPMSNNSSSVYAEVKKNGINDVKEGAIYSDVKPKKGFFKKDGKVKKEKRQKRKQEVADVYENSDDIAMTANPDNVYSNTNHNNDSAKEQRGYKNKDGLLYVEVQFDTKTEDKNPVIHGDDEKTDYATVEFPVPSSSHDRK